MINYGGRTPWHFCLPTCGMAEWRCGGMRPTLAWDAWMALPGISETHAHARAMQACFSMLLSLPKCLQILGMSYSRAGAGIPPRTQAELRAIQGEDHDEQDEMPYYQMHMEPMTLARLEVCVKKMDLSNVYIHVGEDNGAPLVSARVLLHMHAQYIMSPCC